MADDLFEGLPPPSASPLPSSEHQEQDKEPKRKPKFATFSSDSSSSSPAQAPQPVLKSALKQPKQPSEPNPVLKSALKRPKQPSEPNPEGNSSFFLGSNSRDSKPYYYSCENVQSFIYILLCCHLVLSFLAI